MKDLDFFRSKIDEIDEQILMLLNKRMEYVKNIGYLKKNQNIYVPEREKYILDNLFLKNNGILKSEDIKNIYECIFKISKKIELNF